MDDEPLSQAIRDAWSVETADLIADTRSSLVYRVSGRRLPTAIVKCLKPAGMDELKGLHFLDWRDGLGTIRLLDRRDHACLLEDAGTLSLAAHRKTAGDVAATGIIADLVSLLHAPNPHAFPDDLTPLRQHFSVLFSRAVTETDADLRPFFRSTAVLGERLLQTQDGIRPLHGDLHHDNIMSHDGQDWQAIDPHGLIGDPAYDVANVFGNPLDARADILDPQRIIRLAHCFGASMGCSPGKILEYAVVHAALSICWSLDHPATVADRENVAERHAFALTARQLLESKAL